MLAFPDEMVSAEELTVISWILPQTSATKRDNRNQTTYPAERWARARIMGEEYVNNGLRKHLQQALMRENVVAFAPTLLPEWSRKDSDLYTFSSTWSERHVAYAAGLGTFGLCDGLITPVGKAMRAGSVIVRMALPDSPRPYTTHHEYCLFYSFGICGQCIQKCPAGAIDVNGHDKLKCLTHLSSGCREYVKQQYGFEGYGCGLCQVGVPCESGLPPQPCKS